MDQMANEGLAPKQPDSLTKYPRMTLHCSCGNEFNINVMRFVKSEPVTCQICGAEFPVDLGTKFAKAMEDLFHVKYELSERNSGFDIGFVYKSTFKQPPAPQPFQPSDFED
jgi:hypothetical protein